MPKLKSARHHWWPECVSSHWAASDSKTGWIKPDGTLIRVPPSQLGMIRNAHHIKLGDSGVSTPWDRSFENEFDHADSNFPAVLSWLEGLERRLLSRPRRQERFVSQSASDDQLRRLTECIVSLAVRSPMNREASVALAERFRGRLKGPERDSLIAINMKNSQRLVSDTIGARAKFAVLFSQSREFIFGDGFFHNVTAAVNPPQFPTILAPVTPTICVIVTRPFKYMVDPRLSTLVLEDGEVDVCNQAVQVYARTALYFRSECPVIDEAFLRGEHLQYAHPDNPIDELIRSIPGIPARDTSDDFLFDGSRSL